MGYAHYPPWPLLSSTISQYDATIKGKPYKYTTDEKKSLVATI